MNREEILNALVEILVDEIQKTKEELGGDLFHKQKEKKRYALCQLVTTLLKVLEMKPEEATDEELLAIINRIPEPAKKRAKMVLEKTQKGVTPLPRKRIQKVVKGEPQ